MKKFVSIILVFVLSISVYPAILGFADDILNLLPNTTPQYGSNGNFLVPIVDIHSLPDFNEYIEIKDRAGLEEINNNL